MARGGRPSGDHYAVENPLHEVRRGDLLGLRLVRDHQAVLHYVHRHRAHVLGGDVRPMPEECVGPSGQVQVDAGPGGGPILQEGLKVLEASINLNLAARAHAFLRHRAYVTPEDVRAVAMDVMQHRLVITYEAEAEQVAASDLVKRILDTVEVP